MIELPMGLLTWTWILKVASRNSLAVVWRDSKFDDVHSATARAYLTDTQLIN